MPGGVSWVGIVDLDGDAKADLVVIDSNGGRILRGHGDGSFASPADLYVGWFAARAAIGDLNGDGHADLAVASLVDSVSILLGRGDGTFGTRSAFHVGPEPVFVAMADLNGDDHLDVAVANYTGSLSSNSPPPNTIWVLLGSGDGTFGGIWKLDAG